MPHYQPQPPMNFYPQPYGMQPFSPSYPQPQQMMQYPNQGFPMYRQINDEMSEKGKDKSDKKKQKKKVTSRS